MEQFEKVCKGLQTAVDSDWMWRKADYIAMCCKDALTMIRQQQERIAELEAGQKARLMTLEEVHDMAWDYCYLEEEVIKDKVLQKYGGKHRVKCITWPSIASCVLAFGDDAYGKRWRCWTQRPTDEQMEAVKWE